MLFFLVLCCALAPALISAQDPATGWMAYAVGTLPASAERITLFSANWIVGTSANASLSFYSPWFGMDPADNLNLVQPVNPWTRHSWAMYTEYFQWEPESNSNSQQFPVSSGDNLHGEIRYLADSDSYNLTQTDIQTGNVSWQIVKCQDAKKYVIPYFVYEKTFPCKDYPPDEIVTFTDIYIECDGKDCTNEVSWEAKVKDPNCDFTAHIIDQQTISITWSTTKSSVYDKWTYEELLEKNANGWAKHLQ